MTLLAQEAIRLDCQAGDRADAVRQCGAALIAAELVDAPYVDAMLEREATLSTYLGEGFALPHGTNESRAHVRRAGIAVLRFPDGVDWDGARVDVAVAVASASDEHVTILGQLAGVLADPDSAARLRAATDPADVLELLSLEGAPAG
jgi:mannitol/fructose-specific phosphotransferase system IIA component